MTDDTHFLNDTWNVYFHSPYDADWSNRSYRLVTSINSIEEFWCVQNSIRDVLPHGMFFFMREHVFPAWDDTYNIKGGCISLKIPKEQLHETWEKIATGALGERLTADPALWKCVNGISTSPKRYFCILKIWLGTTDVRDKAQLDLPWDAYGGDVIFRTNMENIQTNNVKQHHGGNHGNHGNHSKK